MESRPKLILMLKFLSDFGYLVPDNEKLNTMSFEELELEYQKIDEQDPNKTSNHIINFLSLKDKNDPMLGYYLIESLTKLFIEWSEEKSKRDICHVCDQLKDVSVDLEGDTDNIYHYCSECFLKTYGTYCSKCKKLEYCGNNNIPRWIYGLPRSSNCNYTG